MLPRRRSPFGLAVPVGAVVLFVALWLAAPGWSAQRHDSDRGGVSIVGVSNPRPDLVSGGEVLLRVSTPPGVRASRLRITLNSADVSSDFVAQRDGTLLGLVTGLRAGFNVVRADTSGRFDRWGAAHTGRVQSSDHRPGVLGAAAAVPFYCQTTAFGLAPATMPDLHGHHAGLLSVHVDQRRLQAVADDGGPPGAAIPVGSCDGDGRR